MNSWGQSRPAFNALPNIAICAPPAVIRCWQAICSPFLYKEDLRKQVEVTMVSRVLQIALFCLVPAVAAEGASRDTTRTGCFERSVHDLGIGDTITVFTDDSDVIRGIYGLLDVSSNVLYLRSVSDQGATTRVVVPIETINKLTYRAPSKARSLLTLVCLGVGVFAGGWVGGKLAPRPDGFMDFSGIACVFSGAVIGGLVGASAGNAAGHNMMVTVTLKCK
jgi:hypothetical protein